MKKFICKECNELHDFFEVLEFGLPIKYLAKMQSGDLDYQSDERWFIIGNEIFLIKCVIEIPVISRRKNLSLLVWVALKENEFRSFIDNLISKNGIKKQAGKGKLFSEIPIGRKSMGLDVTYTVSSVSSYPVLNIVDKEIELNSYKENGISVNGAISLLTTVYH